MTKDAFEEHPPEDRDRSMVTSRAVRKAAEGSAGEAVSHPAHYGGADNPYETIKVLRAWLSPDEFRGFLSGNVIKYLSRLGKKGPRAQDAAKAAFYAKALADFEAETDRPDRKVAP